MKNKLTLILAIIMAISMITLLYSCNGNDVDKPNGDNTTQTQKNEDTTPPLKEGLYLRTLGFDNENYTISDFDQEVTEYTVDIPNGNPTIPNVVATAGEGIEVTIRQPETTEEGKYVASVEIKDAEGKTKTYTITMVQDLSAGFVLKVGDKHKFELGYRQEQDGGVYTYYSSHPDIASVDENGIVTALKECNEIVTITAKMGEKPTDFLEIDRIEKAN